MARRESTTLLQLKQEIDNLLETRPELSDARVLIDTEPREFHAYMVAVTSIYAENSECFEGMVALGSQLGRTTGELPATTKR